MEAAANTPGDDAPIAGSGKLSKFELYSSKQRFYIVGQHAPDDRFFIMKIDRTHPTELSIQEDPAEYTSKQIKDVLHMIDDGNKSSGGLKHVKIFYGIFGFIRLLQGYYMILITKRKKVGFLAGHFIYTMTDIEYITVTHKMWRQNLGAGAFNTDNKYKELLKLMDLSNCYFSYSYNLTHTFQRNATHLPQTANERFTWNWFGLEPLRGSTSDAHSRWVLPVIHGYFAQGSFGTADHRVGTLTLIARRSRHFAGVRYLKRGLNERGDCANEVETEQLVQDLSTGFAAKVPQIAAHVQLRGSIPLFWGQDSQIMVPKPPVVIVRSDPYYRATVHHFSDLLERYGSPVLILNLVKSVEKIPRETLLKEEFETCITLLNETLPPEHRIIYVPWDFLRAQKMRTADPVSLLGAIAEATLTKTGFFSSPCPSAYQAQLPNKEWVYGDLQHGVVRTNCVDSLDRTNAAQYCIGRGVLEHQLAALGLAHNDAPSHALLTMAMEMYEDMGNHLAMQYGGSHLAHTIKNFESKTWGASLKDQSRELLTSFQRYYSNSFTDAEKQASMNLFLGVYLPWKEWEELWALDTDYLLHMSPPETQLLLRTRWWEAALRHAASCTPAPERVCNPFGFDEYYAPHKLSSFDKLLQRHNYVVPFASRSTPTHSPSAATNHHPHPHTSLNTSATIRISPSTLIATTSPRPSAPPDDPTAAVVERDRSVFERYLTVTPSSFIATADSRQQYHQCFPQRVPKVPGPNLTLYRRSYMVTQPPEEVIDSNVAVRHPLLPTHSYVPLET